MTPEQRAQILDGVRSGAFRLEYSRAGSYVAIGSGLAMRIEADDTELAAAIKARFDRAIATSARPEQRRSRGD